MLDVEEKPLFNGGTNMSRRKELEKMKVTELVVVANKYDISTDKKKSELIEAILNVENPPKKTRPPRNAASTKLKALRVKAGLTQREVVERTGINPGTYTQYEQGVKKFDNARINVILKVCVVLGCKLEDILEDPDYLEILNEYNSL